MKTIKKEVYAVFWKKEVRSDYLVNKDDVIVGVDTKIEKNNLWIPYVFFDYLRDAKLYLGGNKDWEIRKISIEYKD